MSALALPVPVIHRTIALVGLMGAGKSSVGKRLADSLGLPFRDGDDEIEIAAGMTVPEIFDLYGEQQFREAERRVMNRLLTASPVHVLGTGGGAFMNEQTRALMKASSTTIWLKADIDVLAKRVARRDNRPLLKGKDPVEVLSQLAKVRYPIYAEADITIESGDLPHSAAVAAIVEALRERAEKEPI